MVIDGSPTIQPEPTNGDMRTSFSFTPSLRSSPVYTSASNAPKRTSRGRDCVSAIVEGPFRSMAGHADLAQACAGRERTASLTIESQCIDVFGSNVAEQQRRVCWVEPEPVAKPPSQREPFQFDYLFNFSILDEYPDHVGVVPSGPHKVNRVTIVRPGWPTTRTNMQFRPLFRLEVINSWVVLVPMRQRDDEPAIWRPTRRNQVFRSRKRGDMMAGKIEDAQEDFGIVGPVYTVARREDHLPSIRRPVRIHHRLIC